MKPILLSTTGNNFLVGLRCFGPMYVMCTGNAPSPAYSGGQKILVLDAPSAQKAIETASAALMGEEVTMNTGSDEEVLRTELLSVMPVKDIPNEYGLFITRYPTYEETHVPAAPKRLVFEPCSREESIHGDTNAFAYFSDGRQVYDWLKDTEYGLESIADGSMTYMKRTEYFELPPPRPSPAPPPVRTDDNDLPPAYEEPDREPDRVVDAEFIDPEVDKGVPF